MATEKSCFPMYTKLKALRRSFKKMPVLVLAAASFIGGYFSADAGSKILPARPISVSDDGLQWSEAAFLDLNKHLQPWWTTLRTPFGLIPERDGSFTVFFTTCTRGGFACLGRFSLRRIAVK